MCYKFLTSCDGLCVRVLVCGLGCALVVMWDVIRCVFGLRKTCWGGGKVGWVAESARRLVGRRGGWMGMRAMGRWDSGWGAGWASGEIMLWMAPSDAPKALRASECREMLDRMRANSWISAQH